jgi:hypothetical protein
VSESLKSVADMVAERPDLDSSEHFDGMWSIIGELWDRVRERFDLTVDPSTEPLRAYGDPEGAHGSLQAYTGPEVDWLVHSWVGNPRMSFTNMHLSIWLGPHVDVPHLAYAFGTMPEIWFYTDCVPRRDLAIDLDYLDRYYAPENERWLEVRERPELTTFTSRSIEVREQLSPTAYCYLMSRSADSVDFIRQLSLAQLDRWFAMLDAAETVPAGDRGALAERDERFRRNVAERDPANVIAVNAFGTETAETLVRALWGGDRVLPRPAGQEAI